MISIILPVYNGSKTIYSTLESIVKQSFKDFEVIIWDDYSTDQSKKIIFNFIKNNPNVKFRYYSNNKNYGLRYTLQMSINKCQMRYIARIDQDDIWLPDKLEIQFNYLSKHNDIDILGSNFNLIDINKNYIGRRNYSGNTNDVKYQLLYRNPICHSSVIIKAEILKKYPYSGYLANTKQEDYDLWCYLALNGYKFHVLNRCLVNYTVGLNNYVYKISADARLISNIYLKNIIDINDANMFYVKNGFENIKNIYRNIKILFLIRKKIKPSFKYFIISILHMVYYSI